jgi:hypothetical protein
MPPLWYVQQKLTLSDRYPSGLEWAETTKRHEEGQMAGRLDHAGTHYTVSLGGERFVTHRLMYYLKTGDDPGSSDVLLKSDGTFELYQRRAVPSRRRRNNRKQDSL